LLLWNPTRGARRQRPGHGDGAAERRAHHLQDRGRGRCGGWACSAPASTSIRATQDLQIISGLPPLVREGDQFRAQFTLRNTTQAAMKVEVTPRATCWKLPADAGHPRRETREVAWNVTAPAQLARPAGGHVVGSRGARTRSAARATRSRPSQRIVPAVPLTVQQATLVQLDGPLQPGSPPPADAQTDPAARRPQA
jgi:hypothetical protein